MRKCLWNHKKKNIHKNFHLLCDVVMTMWWFDINWNVFRMNSNILSLAYCVCCVAHCAQRTTLDAISPFIHISYSLTAVTVRRWRWRWQTNISHLLNLEKGTQQILCSGCRVADAVRFNRNEWKVTPRSITFQCDTWIVYRDTIHLNFLSLCVYWFFYFEMTESRANAPSFDFDSESKSHKSARIASHRTCTIGHTLIHYQRMNIAGTVL